MEQKRWKWTTKRETKAIQPSVRNSEHTLTILPMHRQHHYRCWFGCMRYRLRYSLLFQRNYKTFSQSFIFELFYSVKLQKQIDNEWNNKLNVEWKVHEPTKKTIINKWYFWYWHELTFKLMREIKWNSLIQTIIIIWVSWIIQVHINNNFSLLTLYDD